jgi:hypothetical protein
VEKWIRICTISWPVAIQALMPRMNAIPTPSCCLVGKESHRHLSSIQRGGENEYNDKLAEGAMPEFQPDKVFSGAQVSGAAPDWEQSKITSYNTCTKS